MSFRIGASSSSFGASSSRMDDNSDLLSLLEGNLGKSSATRFDLSLVPLLLSNSMNESRTDPLQCSTPHHELEDMNFDADLHAKLQRAFAEIAKLKKENYEESSRRQEAEKELLMVYQKAKKLQDYLKEFRPPKEFEEARARNKQEIEILKKEIEQLKIQRDEYLENFQVANEQKLALVQCVSDSDRAANALENDLEAYKCVLDSMQMEYDQMQRERDTAVRDAEELRKNSEFSLPELELATENFSASRKIGEGGFGRVYKGSIRNTTVAIKMLRPENLQGQLQFEQEVSILSKVRHPHLVTFIGACQEASGLVYEYLPNGSLEDHLACTGNTPALTWRSRTRIIGEICSALMFLHNHTPQPVVHGDLKPSNILLDANFVSKLSDFGIARLLVQSETGTMLYHTVHPMGTPAYSDPEYIATGELTSQSDVYSFGIIILRLLTGKPPVGIAKEVEEAMASDALHTIIDESAGDWPFVQAQQLAHIGMRCVAMSRRERPDLVNDVWTMVGPMMKSASLSTSPSTSSSVHDESNVPFYFVCPIFQEVMTDPHIAADGFTYEAEVIEGWLNGHDTSPMSIYQMEALKTVLPARAISQHSHGESARGSSGRFVLP